MKTILLGLNELNLAYICKYIESGSLKNFKQLFDKYGVHETISEERYELLEPWIQWVTITTGKSYDEHKVFRLGDITSRKDLDQIFENIEARGYSVGAISPFNVENRLKKPAFFVPDPWTQTQSSGSFILRNLSNAISQAVNDNAQSKITVKSAMFFILGILYYSKLKDYLFYMSKMHRFSSLKGLKAILLDKLLGDVFLREWEKTQPDFSNLFLNSGAHIQHHYMFNSRNYSGKFKNPEWYCPQNQDPLFEILKVYDFLLGKLMKFPVRLVITTGLHQEPHSELTYYWRLKNHTEFIRVIGISKYKSIYPRMSRDFLVTFNNEEDARISCNILMSFKSKTDQTQIFSVDNRGESLFVELIYPHDIVDHFSIVGNVLIENFKKHVSFVAIKNGEHNGIGYVIDTEHKIIDQRIHLKQIHSSLLEEYK